MSLRWRPTSCHSSTFESKSTSSGLRPDAGDFLLFGQEKVTKEKATPVSRAWRVPCAACLTSAAVELAQFRAASASGLSSNSPRRHPRGQESCSARHRGPNYAVLRCAAPVWRNALR